MIKLNKNKIPLVITSAALLSAVISCLYVQRAKSKAEGEILHILQGCRRVREQNAFPHPTKSDLESLTGKGCGSIAAQIENNTYSDDDFGNHSRECAVLILNNLAENMTEGENLAEYFARKNMDEEYYAESVLFIKVFAVIVISVSVVFSIYTILVVDVYNNTQATNRSAAMYEIGEIINDKYRVFATDNSQTLWIADFEGCTYKAEVSFEKYSQLSYEKNWYIP